jgi:hypothetical protein
MKKSGLFSCILIALLATASALAVDLKVATFNAYLYFDPTVQHVGQVDDQERMTPAQYAEKTANLMGMTRGIDIVGLQEVGGRVEVENLARVGGYSWGFAKGNDTFTGQNVGILYRLPGWRVSVDGRVGALDRLISKHVLMTAEMGSTRLKVLVVHLIRPIGAQQAKHDAQIKAISEWATGVSAREPKTVLVVLGDMNDTRKAALFPGSREANELVRYAGTHNDGRPYDRMAVFGPGSWSEVVLKAPPYGNKPNKSLLRVWTDHRLLGATLRISGQ